MHPRAAIRKSVRELLIAAGTSAGERVYDTRIWPAVNQEAAIFIYGTDELVAREDIETVGLRKRTLELWLKCCLPVIAQDEDTFSQQLDDLATQVEEVMDGDPLLKDTAEAVWLDRTEFTLSAEGEQLIGVVNLIYSVQYRG